MLDLKIDSEKYRIEISRKPKPSELILRGLVDELVRNRLAYALLAVAQETPDISSLRLAIEERNNLLYEELDKREERYTK